MITEFVTRFVDAKTDTLARLAALSEPLSYQDLLTIAVSVIAPPDDYGYPDATRISVINHGDYQGTLVFVIAASGYQPSQYWVTAVSYGSCSVCDTLQGIEDGWPRDDDYNRLLAGETLAAHYWALMLHMMQRLRVGVE